MTVTYSRIRATGTSLTDRAETNGVGEQSTIGPAEGASRQALDDAGLNPADIDFLVIGTTSPDIVFPNGGCLLQERLGITGCAAFSVEAGSTGFNYALSIADRFIVGHQATCALVVGADILSGQSEASDRAAPAKYTAAAGAVILESAGEPGILSSQLGSGRRKQQLPPESAAQKHADTLEAPDTGDFQSAVTSLRTGVDETLTRHKLAGGDIDWMIPQETSLARVQAISRGLGIAAEKVIVAPEDYGDMVTATIPLAFDHASRNGQIATGDLILLAALGNSGTWGSALIRYRK